MERIRETAMSDCDRVETEIDRSKGPSARMCWTRCPSVCVFVCLLEGDTLTSHRCLAQSWSCLRRVMTRSCWHSLGIAPLSTPKTQSLIDCQNSDTTMSPCATLSHPSHHNQHDMAAGYRLRRQPDDYYNCYHCWCTTSLFTHLVCHGHRLGLGIVRDKLELVPLPPPFVSHSCIIDEDRSVFFRWLFI